MTSIRREEIRTHLENRTMSLVYLSPKLEPFLRISVIGSNHMLTANMAREMAEYLIVAADIVEEQS